MTEIKLTTFKTYNNVGEEIPFAHYVQEFAGPSIYQKHFANVLKGWRHADWVYTDEYIAPLVSQIIVDACELDHEMFAKIMTLVEEAFEKFQPIVYPHQLSLVSKGGNHNG